MINDITVHRITNVNVKAATTDGPSESYTYGPSESYWIDVIVERPHCAEERQERFEFTMFCKGREQAVTLLEKMKHDITNILQEFDQEKNDEQV